MELKNMSDIELAKRLVNYIERANDLLNVIGQYLEEKRHPVELTENIRRKYKQLKNDVVTDANYLNLVKNRNGSDFYKTVFSRSITEASSEGFTSSANSRVNQKMFSSVYDAEYKLEKFCSVENLRAFIENDAPIVKTYG